MKNTTVFLEENISRILWLNAIPALGGIILLAVNSLADGLLVSRLLGQQALAGLTLATPVIIFQSALGTLVATGASVLISKALGNGNKPLIQKVFTNIHILAILLALINYLLYCFLAMPLLKLLSANRAEIAYAYDFYSVFSKGAIIVILSLSYGALLRSGGKFGRISLHLFVALLVNIGFSFWLLPVLGIRGCALAMLASMFAYAVLNYFQVVKLYALNLQLTFSFTTISDICSIGISSFLFQFTAIIRQALIIKFIHITSSGSVALYGSISRILALAIIPAQALIISFQPMFITNLSANHFERCRQLIRITRQYAAGVSVIVFITCLLFSSAIITYYMDTPTIPVSYFEAYCICLTLIVFYPFSSLSFVLLQSSGQHQYTTIISALRETVLLLPIALLFYHLNYQNAIYWAILTEVILYSTFMFSLAQYKIAGLLKPDQSDEVKAEQLPQKLMAIK